MIVVFAVARMLPTVPGVVPNASKSVDACACWPTTVEPTTSEMAVPLSVVMLTPAVVVPLPSVSDVAVEGAMFRAPGVSMVSESWTGRSSGPRRGRRAAARPERELAAVGGRSRSDEPGCAAPRLPYERYEPPEKLAKRSDDVPRVDVLSVLGL